MNPAGPVLVCGIEGTTLTSSELGFFRSVSPSGVTLFTRNVPEDQGRLKDLVATLQATRAAGSPPLVVAIDQEGGRVRRLKAPFPDAGPAMTLASGGTDAAALQVVRHAARDLGTRLLALGINVDFAPVLDVLTEPTNTAIGDRAFGTEPAAVTARAGAFLEGLSAAGVRGCLKHFPGQGSAKVDTHLGGATVDAARSLLDRRELVPFKALLNAAPMVMISHCIYPALAPEEASRSPRVMQGLLREEMGFTGVIVSDDMNMGAVPQDLGPWTAAVIETVANGADMVLVCRHLDRFVAAHEALTREARRSPAFEQRLNEAAGRVLALRGTLKGG